MNDTLDETAQRIAEKGHDALLARLRPAFEQAAAAHADVLQLDDDALEQMVQDAADRADGLQWRRALAFAATEELGIGLGEALGHPAVVRAQAIVGAPSYEESLAAMIGEGAAERESVTEAGAGGESETGDEIETGVNTTAGDETETGVTTTAGDETETGVTTTAGDETETEGETETAGQTETGVTTTAGDETETEGETETGGGGEAEDAASDAGANGMQIKFALVHLNGLAELDRESEIELRFSAAGLDVVPAGSDEAAVRLSWSEIRRLEVEPRRGGMLRRRGAGARLTLTATDRRARFEAEGADSEELKSRLAVALKTLGEGQ